MTKLHDETIEQLKQKNQLFQQKYHTEFKKHLKGQSPKIAVLTCSDSRVIPELIFDGAIGELFVVRIAGNIILDETIIDSINYAIDHHKITHLIVLAHSHCGAVKAAEEAGETNIELLKEIQRSFPLNSKDHVLANLSRQLDLLPHRSQSISNAIKKGSLRLIGAMYHLENGHVDFF
ncbi:MAG: carbonic anhydrase [Candidatus Thermoplasmatota archaeon]|nr:carbonic anhydrase [Candidatus Thermoplasmatota archaeon]